MKIVLTICSRKKSHTKDDLPAYLRYASKRIDDVRAIAKRKGLPFYILSGKYGLVAEDEIVPHYDHLLKSDEVANMVMIVSEQNKHFNITDIEFCAEDRQGNWVPYYEVIERFSREQKINLQIANL